MLPELTKHSIPIHRKKQQQQTWISKPESSKALFTYHAWKEHWKFLSPVHIHASSVTQLHFSPSLGVFISKRTWNIESESIPQSRISQESHGWQLRFELPFCFTMASYVSLLRKSQKILQTSISRFHELRTFLDWHVLNVLLVVFKYASSVCHQLYSELWAWFLDRVLERSKPMTVTKWPADFQWSLKPGTLCVVNWRQRITCYHFIVVYSRLPKVLNNFI